MRNVQINLELNYVSILYMLCNITLIVLQQLITQDFLLYISGYKRTSSTASWV